MHVLLDAVLGDGPTITVNGRIEEVVSGIPIVRSGVWLVRVNDRVEDVWAYVDQSDADG